MPATRDGKMWRSQFYYKDWQGVRHKKNKRGFRTKAEAIWTSILRTLFRFITKIWNTGCVKIP